MVGPAVKEVWQSAWAADSPRQFEALERQKLVIYNDLAAENVSNQKCRFRF
jgi:hypothetical protein